MVDDQTPDESNDGELNDATAEGIYEISKAFADLLRDQRIKDAVAAWLTSQAAKGAQDEKPNALLLDLYSAF